ncbi:MAG: SocA family protein [Planctomycetaceae bacterium]|nr:SocA family protein [Planctomycetaceae bacterium]
MDNNSTQFSAGLASADEYDLLADRAAPDVAEMKVRSARKSKYKLQEITADVFSQLLLQFCSQHGDFISNLKLQKLLYYSQAWYLALHEKELFPEPIEAWANGPGLPEIYEKYREFGHRPIIQDCIELSVPKKITKHIEDVMKAYGHLSSYDLECISCEEEPWLGTRKRSGGNNDSVIPSDQMKNFYKLRIDV